MFSKTSSNGSSNGKGHVAAVKAAVPSVLSADLKVVGNLTSEGEIHIDGTIEGDVRSRILLIGESAVIRGQIEAQSVTVHGTVLGQIRARSVNLARTARVTGDILHETLSIDKGAFLEGHCRRLDRKADAGDGRSGTAVKSSHDPVSTREPKGRSAVPVAAAVPAG